MPTPCPDNLLFLLNELSGEAQPVAEKVCSGERISPEEALLLWEKSNLSVLVALAGFVRRKRHNNHAFYNRNIHIEPTNFCVRHCRFCSYYRNEGDKDAWNYSAEEILEQIGRHPGITEVHITGGLHPSKDLGWYADLFRQIRSRFPSLHIKALTAEEIDYLAQQDHSSPEKVLTELKHAGLQSIPGGGAEIFHPEVRKRICPEKITADQWLEVHATAHRLGITSNATMLFGHVEKPEHRIHHLLMLRELQDKTHGFYAFIPLKYKSAHNHLSYIGETSFADVVKTFAIARIFLDNIPHLKAYWPMLGKEHAALMLHFGADDFDGTIHDSTRIYTMAGAKEQHPSLTPNEIISLIQKEGFEAVERNSKYEKVNEN